MLRLPIMGRSSLLQKKDALDLPMAGRFIMAPEAVESPERTHRRMQMIEFQVNDMTCGHCAATITRAVTDIEPAAKVDIDLATHRVRITAVGTAQRFETAIRDAGYTPLPATA